VPRLRKKNIKDVEMGRLLCLSLLEGVAPRRRQSASSLAVASLVRKAGSVGQAIKACRSVLETLELASAVGGDRKRKEVKKKEKKKKKKKKLRVQPFWR
jgi:hypothetical protein